MTPAAKKWLAQQNLTPFEHRLVEEKLERASASPTALLALEGEARALLAGKITEGEGDGTPGFLGAIVGGVEGLRAEIDGADPDPWGVEDDAATEARQRREFLAKADELERAGDKEGAAGLRSDLAAASAESEMAVRRARTGAERDTERAAESADEAAEIAELFGTSEGAKK